MMHVRASNANGILIHLNYKMLSTFSVIALSVYMFVDTQSGLPVCSIYGLLCRCAFSVSPDVPKRRSSSAIT